ncbi:hypothetical protein J7K50_03560, partial [bacterium]|nr:hypothetical protein [bacterium]
LGEGNMRDYINAAVALVLSVAFLAITVSLFVGNNRAFACTGTPCLVERFDELSQRRQKTLTESLTNFENSREEYYKFISECSDARREWLASVPTDEHLQIQAQLLTRGICIVQMALETYSTWNDGIYPETLDDLLCPELALLGSFCENPFSTGTSKQIGLNTISPGDLWYIPQYEDGSNSGDVIGYWLVILGNDSLHGQNLDDLLIEPLPGGITVPGSSWVVLETHYQ